MMTPAEANAALAALRNIGAELRAMAATSTNVNIDDAARLAVPITVSPNPDREGGP